MAADFKIIDPVFGAPTPVTVTGTTQKWALGLVQHAVDRQSSSGNLGGGVFQYCVGSDVLSVGQWVQIQGNTAILLNENNSASYFPIGVAAGALSASNVYGWVQLAGICDYARGTDSSIAAGAPLYIHTNSDQPGYVVAREGTEIVHLGHQVIGAVLPNSYTSSQSASMTVILNYPGIMGLTASI